MEIQTCVAPAEIWPRKWLAAGALQRGLLDDAEVRPSGVYLPQCLRPQAVRHGQALCLPVKTRKGTQGELRTGSDVYQPIAGLLCAAPSVYPE